MGDIILALILYTKNYPLPVEIEEAVFGATAIQDYWVLVHSRFFHMLLQFIVLNLSYLGQSIHAFLYFHVHKAFMC